jgi:predicted dehydrogenase
METLGIGVVGFGWMGRVHTQAYARVRHHYPAAVRPVLIAVADEVPGRADAAAAQFGFETATRDWRTLLDDPRIDAVSITAPNFLHREMGVAFAEAGKHIWIEKPVGLTAADARAIAQARANRAADGEVRALTGDAHAAADHPRSAAASAPGDAASAGDDAGPNAGCAGSRSTADRVRPADGDAGAPADRARSVAGDARAVGGDVQVSVGFNYRNAPAVEKARELVRAGAIGRVTHARVRLFSDYAAHPDGALSWRFERARGGNGVLGDLGAHGVDLVRYLLGEIDALVADTAVFVPERPRPAGATAGHQRGSGAPGPVENDDYFSSLLRMASGARVVLEASRVAVGEQNAYGFELHGTAGAIFWDFRRMGELGIAGGPDIQDEPVRTVFVGPRDGDYAAFQPGAGTAMSYDDLKVIEAYRFLRSVETGTPHGATLTDAIASAEALDAATRSAATGAWIKLAR